MFRTVRMCLRTCTPSGDSDLTGHHILHCSLKETLDHWPSKGRSAKTQIRLYIRSAQGAHDERYICSNFGVFLI